MILLTETAPLLELKQIFFILSVENNLILAQNADFVPAIFFLT